MSPPNLWKRSLCGTLAVAIFVTSWPPASSWAQPSSAVPPHSPLELVHLDLAALAIPERLGSIQEIWQPSEGLPRGLVIHLQDVHAHPEAQRHLSELIAHLRRRLGITLVALEGAEGACDTSFFSAFPDAKIVARVSRAFVEEGLFTGAEEYAITHPGQVTLWGVEEAPVYLQHLQAYRQGIARQAGIEHTLTRLSASLHRQAQRSYPPAMRQLLALRRAASAARPPPGAFTRYLQALFRLSRRHRVSLRPVNASRPVDPRRLMQEIDAVQDAVEQAALTTEPQRALAPLLRWTELVSGLLHAQLSPAQVAAYQAQRDAMTPEALWRLMQRATTGHPPLTRAHVHALMKTLPLAERFYELAHARDTILVRNTLQKLFEDHAVASSLEPSTSSGVPSALLVAGGFHTPGITQRLKAQGIAYVVITPRVTRPVSDAMYRARLQGQVPDPSQLLASIRASRFTLQTLIGTGYPGAEQNVSYFDRLTRQISHLAFGAYLKRAFTDAYHTITIRTTQGFLFATRSLVPRLSLGMLLGMAAWAQAAEAQGQGMDLDEVVMTLQLVGIVIGLLVSKLTILLRHEMTDKRSVGRDIGQGFAAFLTVALVFVHLGMLTDLIAIPGFHRWLSVAGLVILWGGVTDWSRIRHRLKQRSMKRKVALRAVGPYVRRLSARTMADPQRIHDFLERVKQETGRGGQALTHQRLLNLAKSPRYKAYSRELETFLGGITGALSISELNTLMMRLGPSMAAQRLGLRAFGSTLSVLPQSDVPYETWRPSYIYLQPLDEPYYLILRLQQEEIAQLTWGERGRDHKFDTEKPFAFIRFYRLGDRLIVTTIQSMVHGRLSSKSRDRLADWEEMLLYGLEDLGLAQGVNEIWIYPDQRSNHIYRTTPQRLGYQWQSQDTQAEREALLVLGLGDELHHALQARHFSIKPLSAHDERLRLFRRLVGATRPQDSSPSRDSTVRALIPWLSLGMLFGTVAWSHAADGLQLPAHAWTGVGWVGLSVVGLGLLAGTAVWRGWRGLGTPRGVILKISDERGASGSAGIAPNRFQSTPSTRWFQPRPGRLRASPWGLSLFRTLGAVLGVVVPAVDTAVALRQFRHRENQQFTDPQTNEHDLKGRHDAWSSSSSSVGGSVQYPMAAEVTPMPTPTSNARKSSVGDTSEPTTTTVETYLDTSKKKRPSSLRRISSFICSQVYVLWRTMSTSRRYVLIILPSLGVLADTLGLGPFAQPAGIAAHLFQFGLLAWLAESIGFAWLRRENFHEAPNGSSALIGRGYSYEELSHVPIESSDELEEALDDLELWFGETQGALPAGLNVATAGHMRDELRAMRHTLRRLRAQGHIGVIHPVYEGRDRWYLGFGLPHRVGIAALLMTREGVFHELYHATFWTETQPTRLEDDAALHGRALRRQAVLFWKLDPKIVPDLPLEALERHEKNRLGEWIRDWKWPFIHLQPRERLGRSSLVREWMTDEDVRQLVAWFDRLGERTSQSFGQVARAQQASFDRAWAALTRGMSPAGIERLEHELREEAAQGGELFHELAIARTRRRIEDIQLPDGFGFDSEGGAGPADVPHIHSATYHQRVAVEEMVQRHPVIEERQDRLIPFSLLNAAVNVLVFATAAAMHDGSAAATLLRCALVSLVPAASLALVYFRARRFVADHDTIVTAILPDGRVIRSPPSAEDRAGYLRAGLWYAFPYAAALILDALAVAVLPLTPPQLLLAIPGSWVGLFISYELMKTSHRRHNRRAVEQLLAGQPSASMHSKASSGPQHHAGRLRRRRWRYDWQDVPEPFKPILREIAQTDYLQRAVRNVGSEIVQPGRRLTISAVPNSERSRVKWVFRVAAPVYNGGRTVEIALKIGKPYYVQMRAELGPAHFERIDQAAEALFRPQLHPRIGPTEFIELRDRRSQAALERLGYPPGTTGVWVITEGFVQGPDFLKARQTVIDAYEAQNISKDAFLAQLGRLDRVIMWTYLRMWEALQRRQFILDPHPAQLVLTDRRGLDIVLERAGAEQSFAGIRLPARSHYTVKPWDRVIEAMVIDLDVLTDQAVHPWDLLVRVAYGMLAQQGASEKAGNLADETILAVFDGVIDALGVEHGMAFLERALGHWRTYYGHPEDYEAGIPVAVDGETEAIREYRLMAQVTHLVWQALELFLAGAAIDRVIQTSPVEAGLPDFEAWTDPQTGLSIRETAVLSGAGQLLHQQVGSALGSLWLAAHDTAEARQETIAATAEFLHLSPASEARLIRMLDGSAVSNAREADARPSTSHITARALLPWLSLGTLLGVMAGLGHAGEEIPAGSIDIVASASGGLGLWGVLGIVGVVLAVGWLATAIFVPRDRLRHMLELTGLATLGYVLKTAYDGVKAWVHFHVTLLPPTVAGITYGTLGILAPVLFFAVALRTAEPDPLPADASTQEPRSVRPTPYTLPPPPVPVSTAPSLRSSSSLDPQALEALWHQLVQEGMPPDPLIATEQGLRDIEWLLERRHELTLSEIEARIRTLDQTLAAVGGAVNAVRRFREAAQLLAVKNYHEALLYVLRNDSQENLANLASTIDGVRAETNEQTLPGLKAELDSELIATLHQARRDRTPAQLRDDVQFLEDEVSSSFSGTRADLRRIAIGRFGASDEKPEAAVAAYRELEEQLQEASVPRGRITSLADWLYADRARSVELALEQREAIEAMFPSAVGEVAVWVSFQDASTDPSRTPLEYAQDYADQYKAVVRRLERIAPDHRAISGIAQQAFTVVTEDAVDRAEELLRERLEEERAQPRESGGPALRSLAGLLSTGVLAAELLLPGASWSGELADHAVGSAEVMAAASAGMGWGAIGGIVGVVALVVVGVAALFVGRNAAQASAYVGSLDSAVSRRFSMRSIFRAISSSWVGTGARVLTIGSSFPTRSSSSTTASFMEPNSERSPVTPSATRDTSVRISSSKTLTWFQLGDGDARFIHSSWWTRLRDTRVHMRGRSGRGPIVSPAASRVKQVTHEHEAEEVPLNEHLTDSLRSLRKTARSL